MDLVFATNNNHKLTEAKKLLYDLHIVKSLTDIGCKTEIPEDFETLEANAEQKARFIFDRYGLNCFADDTGLEVFSLDMQPGVYSARYAGIDGNSQNNINKLLREIEGFSNRKARFRTVIALIIEGELHLFEGLVNGSIANSRKGNDGFGYDPVFVPDGYDQSFAEMSLQKKNEISHRALALNELLRFLSKYGTNK